MLRDDVGTKLVHLTRGTGDDPKEHRKEAARTLIEILKSERLIGNNGFIRGGYNCVCFSEAPISKLSHLIAGNHDKAFKYQPYGVLVDKKWAYSRGGRPVIYGPEIDYLKLPSEMRYRHVRFFMGNYVIDHTWEREWRIKTEGVPLNPKDVTIVTPDRTAKDAFQERYPKWHYIALSDLGVVIDPMKNS